MKTKTNTLWLLCISAVIWIQTTSDSIAAGDYRKFADTNCAWCGATNSLEVHHVIPVNIFGRLTGSPLYTNEENLVTLCRVDHLKHGHRGNFKDFDRKFWLTLYLHTNKTDLVPILNAHRTAEVE